MIPRAYIQEWSSSTPWPDLRQVEQDLIISRALCDIFNNPRLAERLAFRGGTAINKLLFTQPLRYSEDIDLVQVRPEPFGPTINEIRRTLSWLGPCKRKAGVHSTHLVFAFAPEADPASSLKLKVEINTREHDSLYGLRQYPFAVENRWHTAETSIISYEPEELFGTKLRALLQRQKNRDLFDLNEALTMLSLDTARVVATFHHYLAHEGHQITRANAQERMLAKLTRSLTDDIAPLLAAGVNYAPAEAQRAFERVWLQLIALLHGAPWQHSEAVIQELRETSYPTLLLQEPRR